MALCVKNAQRGLERGRETEAHGSRTRLRRNAPHIGFEDQGRRRATGASTSQSTGRPVRCQGKLAKYL